MTTPGGGSSPRRRERSGSRTECALLEFAAHLMASPGPASGRSGGGTGGTCTAEVDLQALRQSCNIIQARVHTVYAHMSRFVIMLRPAHLRAYEACLTNAKSVTKAS